MSLPDHPLTKLTGGRGLLEGARWYPHLGLVFSDMTTGGVYALRPGSAQAEILVEHRKGIGGLVAHAEGGLVVSGRNLARRRLPPDPTPSEVLLQAQPDEQFFNDLTADGAGRLYVGSVGKRRSATEDDALGRLYRIGLDATVDVLADDVIVSNGLGIDPTGRFLYHVDTGRRCLWRFDLAAADAGGSRIALIDTSGHGGVPDGIAVAENGSIWIAMAGGGAVVGWDAAGRTIAEIAVPQPLVTSVCFGGADRRELYILTGPDDDSSREPEDQVGSVYRTEIGIAGLTSPFARVPLGASG